MSATDDLREKLGMAFARSFYVGPEAMRIAETERTFGRHIDALMPTVREALAEAFDRGWEESGEGYNHEWPPGNEIPDDRPANPWREADRG